MCVIFLFAKISRFVSGVKPKHKKYDSFCVVRWSAYDYTIKTSEVKAPMVVLFAFPSNRIRELLRDLNSHYFFAWIREKQDKFGAKRIVEKKMKKPFPPS